MAVTLWIYSYIWLWKQDVFNDTLNIFKYNVSKVAGHKLDYDCKKRHGAQVYSCFHCFGQIDNFTPAWLEIGSGQWHFQFWVVRSPIVLLPGKTSVKPAQGGELQDAERKFAESYKVLIIEHLNKMNNERTWWTTSKSIWLFFSVVPVSDAQRATEWLRVYHAVGCPLLLPKCKTQTN